jgi:predicted thioesterase
VSGASCAALVFDERLMICGHSSVTGAPGRDAAGGGTGARVTMGDLIAAVEALCGRVLSQHSEHADSCSAATAVECRHVAPIVAGTSVRFSGWMETIDDERVQFCVYGYDQQERVCEARVELDVGCNGRTNTTLFRKREAASRRAMFDAA